MGVRAIVRTLLAIMAGRLDKIRLLNEIIAAMAARTWASERAIAVGVFSSVIGQKTPNLLPLSEMLNEYRRLHNERLAGYQTLVNESAKQIISIGRRGQDIIREIPLNVIEDQYLKGGSGLSIKDAIIAEFQKRANPALGEKIAAGYSPIDTELRKYVPVVSNGERFYLKTQFGTMRSYDVEHYAELIASTTTTEAGYNAQEQRARDVETRLVKFNSTGKGKQWYLKQQDYRCAAVDGQIFSIEEGGTTIRGRYFKSWREVLNGDYHTCHPFCDHYFRPHSEALV